MTPEQIAKDTEHSQQAAFFCWLQQQSFDDRLRYAFAIPNGGERNVKVASRLKAEGVKPGVPDVFIPIPATIYAGMWIEFKRPGTENQRSGRMSSDQEKWRDFLISQHYFHKTVFNHLQAAESVLIYLGHKASQ